MTLSKKEIVKKVKYALSISSELPELEFKTAKTELPRNIWKSISAFANRRGGGLLILGVDQEIGIIGCKDIDKIQTKLIEYFDSKMSFVLRPNYHVIESGGKTIIAVEIPQCPKDNMPCYFKPAGLPDGAYIRDGNRSRRITESELRDFMAASREFQFDLSEALNTELKDLSQKKVLHLLDKREDIIQRGAKSKFTNTVLHNLGIASKFGGIRKPTVGGYLIFAQDTPQDRSPYERYTVRCVRYSGTNPASTIVDSLNVKGTLDAQIDDAYGFVLKHMNKTSHIIGTKRVEQFEYPEEAIRELIANAIIHRDYKIIETYTQIKIFEDRIEILSPGSLPPGVTVDNIKDEQFSRNSIIAARLKDLEYLEEYGRGIDIVIEKMAELGLPKPIFRNLANSFVVVLLGNKYSKLNDRQKKIIDTIFLQERLTAKDCKKVLKGASRGTINKDLRDLKDLGIIVSNGASVNIFYTLAF